MKPKSFLRQSYNSVPSFKKIFFTIQMFLGFSLLYFYEEIEERKGKWKSAPRSKGKNIDYFACAIRKHI